jgi:hypothetical protein
MGSRGLHSSKQSTLFDITKAVSRQLARRADPMTSKAAASAVVKDLGRLQHWALGVVREYPSSTVNEMADKLQLRDPRKLGRRMNELVARGCILEMGSRKCRITGRHAAIYEVANRSNV